MGRIIITLFYEIHRTYLCLARQPQAAGGMEVHVTRCRDLELARLQPPPRGGSPVAALEGPRECLMGGEPGFQSDVEDPPIGRDQPVRGSFEEYSTPKRPGRLARCSPYDPVEVTAGQVGAGG